VCCVCGVCVCGVWCVVCVCGVCVVCDVCGVCVCVWCAMCVWYVVCVVCVCGVCKNKPNSSNMVLEHVVLRQRASSEEAHQGVSHVDTQASASTEDVL